MNRADARNSWVSWLSPRVNPAGLAVLVLCLGLVDYLTGYELGFFAFYYVPIALAGWHCKRTAAVGVATLCALVWLASDYLSEHPYTSAFFQAWNVLIRLAAFLALALIVSRYRETLEKQRSLADRLATALGEVRELKGLLPICAWCKQVRNDQGYWEHIEAYLATRTGAEFTHSVCPTCARKFDTEELV